MVVDDDEEDVGEGGNGDGDGDGQDGVDAEDISFYAL